MAQHNAIEMEVAQANSGEKTVNAFRRREPLKFSPERPCPVAVISPLQKNDSSEPVFADGGSPAISSPDHSRSRFEENIFRIQRHSRRWRATRFQPFSFDERDAARRVERERRLQEMRQMQDQWCSTFKAHPVRRYKPLVQPPAHFKGRSEHSK